METYKKLGPRVEALLVRTFANLAKAWPEILIYILAYVLWFAADPSKGMNLAAMVKPLIFVAGMYFVYRAMLQRSGSMETEDTEVLAFTGMTILFLPLVGMSFMLVIPGIFVMMKLLIAPSVLVARSSDIFVSASESWKRTRGHGIPIALAILALYVLAEVLGKFMNAMDQAFVDADLWMVQGLGKSLLFIHFPILMAGLSTAAYEMLPDPAVAGELPTTA